MSALPASQPFISGWRQSIWFSDFRIQGEQHEKCML
jgi:hypothetical protein